MHAKVSLALGGFLVVVAAVLVAFALRQGNGAAVVTASPSAPRLSTAIVAKSEITRGELLSADRLTTIEVSGKLPPGVFGSLRAADGAVAVQNIAPGQFVGSFNVATGPNIQAGLSMLVPAGMRAVALRITDEVAVGNFIRSGDRVDILLRLTPSSGSAESARNLNAITIDRQSIVLLQNIEVLSVGSDLNVKNNQDALRARTVTIAVTPEDASKLNLVGELGSFYLALRNPQDEKPLSIQQVRIADLLVTGQEKDERGQAAPVEVPRVPSFSEPHKVTVISGGVPAEKLFRRGGE